MSPSEPSVVASQALRPRAYQWELFEQARTSNVSIFTAPRRDDLAASETERHVEFSMGIGTALAKQATDF